MHCSAENIVSRIKSVLFSIIAILLFFIMIFSVVLKAEVEPGIQQFIDIFHHNKKIFTDKQWEVTEENGIITAKLTIQEPAYENFLYTIDKKNWYMNIVNTTDSDMYSIDLGMYFRKDKTPIVAASRIKECYGPYCGESGIVFYEYRCQGKGKGENCQFKNVTKELFPSVGIWDFLNTSPEAKKLLPGAEELKSSLHVKYIIPRVGTTITAVPWLDGDIFFAGIKEEGKIFDPDKMLNIIFKTTAIKFNWVKNTEKFNRGESIKDLTTIQIYGK